MSLPSGAKIRAVLQRDALQWIAESQRQTESHWNEIGLVGALRFRVSIQVRRVSLQFIPRQHSANYSAHSLSIVKSHNCHRGVFHATESMRNLSSSTNADSWEFPGILEISFPNVLACYDKRSYACRKRAEDLIPMGDAILLDGEL